MKKPRMYAAIGGLALVIAGILFIPLPHSVHCTLEIEARDAAWVHVTVPGILEEVDVQPGDRVEQGTRLARLSSIELRERIVEKEGQRDLYIVRLKNSSMDRHDDPRANASLMELQDALLTVEDELAELRQERRRLELRAPISGTVFPPPWRPDRPSPEGRLARWSGSPFSPRNLGVPLGAEGGPQVPFCQIGDPARLEAILIIDQSDIDFVAEGQEVEIKLDQLPHDTLHGRIEQIAKVEVEQTSVRMSAKGGGEVATEADPTGAQKPLSTSYRANVPLDDEEGLLRLGLLGRAKIHTAPRTLGSRIWRFVSETFAFKL